MNIIACADLHFTQTTPVNRKDNYPHSGLKKFKQILKLAKNNNAIIVIAGDIFDSVNVPYKITKSVLELIEEYKVLIYAVPGQHDLVFHAKGLNNTPLGILETHKCVKILGSKKALHISDQGADLSLIGAGWGEEPKEEADILVTHQMVVRKNPLFHGQKDYKTAKQLLKKYPWASFIISGDNHLPFSVYQKGHGRTLINCGSLMRKGKDQIRHYPCCWLLNKDSRSYKKIKLKIPPAKTVFDFAKIKREAELDSRRQESQKELSEFIDSIAQSKKKKPKFKQFLKSIIKKTKPNKNIQNIINDVMEQIRN